MDRETESRLTKLETWQEDIQEERKAWNKLIRETIAKTVTWLLGVGLAGVMFGWHLPAEVRKWFADWVTK